MFQLYLRDLCEREGLRLERGEYDKAGHDLSDLYRGRISILRDLLSFKEACEKQYESMKAEGATNGVEQSNS